MRFVLPLIFAALTLGVLPSCKRIEAKLRRLAEQSGVTPKPPPPPKPEEPALTAEEQAIEKKLQETALQEAAAPGPEAPRPASGLLPMRWLPSSARAPRSSSPFRQDSSPLYSRCLRGSSYTLARPTSYPRATTDIRVSLLPS